MQFHEQSDKPVQVRTEAGELRYYDTLDAAMLAAEEDHTIWKISCTLRGLCESGRLRLTRNQQGEFVYDPIDIRQFEVPTPGEIEELFDGQTLDMNRIAKESTGI